jgi:hypothetical protein
LLEGAELVVDGETFPSERIRWTLGGTSYSATELTEPSELRWPFEEAAVLTVETPSPLAPGVHDVQVSITWRWSYIPVEMQPTTNISKRRLVLVA